MAAFPDDPVSSDQPEALGAAAAGEPVEPSVPSAGEAVSSADPAERAESVRSLEGASAEEVPDEEFEVSEEELTVPEEEFEGHAEPLEFIDEQAEVAEDLKFDWYIVKIQVNREDSIRDALVRRVKIAGFERYFQEIVIPTEDVAEFNKAGKRRIVKRKLYPGYLMIRMHVNDETWFLVRETPGIGDFTGSGGRPTPMLQRDVERILSIGQKAGEGETQVKTAIPFKHGDRVRVKEGYFQNFEGEVESIDEANGRVTVMINIFGRSTPVELEHWQIEAV